MVLLIGMSKLNPSILGLIQQYQNLTAVSQPAAGAVTISVDEVASRVAAFYEKIRTVVDWQEEHLMRRIEIERILKRRLFLKLNAEEKEGLAENFVRELIRGGYFPNNQIPKSKIQDVKRLIDKYTFILEQAPRPRGKTQSEFYSELIAIAACETEEILDTAFHQKIRILIEFMENVMREKIKIGKIALSKTNLTGEEKNTLIFIAVSQALFKLDQAMINYNLLKRQFPNWFNLSSEESQNIAENIHSIFDNFKKYFSHPLFNKFYQLCEKYDTPYLLIGDIIPENSINIEELMSDEKELERAIKKTYNKRLAALKRKTARSAFYATVSIFLSKMLILYILEDVFLARLTGKIYLLAAILDVAIPTLLMLFLSSTIRLPSSENFRLIMSEIKKIVYESDKKDVYEIEFYPKRPFIVNAVVGLFYFLGICISLGAIAWCFYKLKYPPLSCFILLVFISLISFAGVRIRQRARELHITEDRETLFNFIFDPYALPIIYLGRWIMRRWRKINLVAVFFNLLLDAPILVFVEFLEHWRYFLKEKKEEIHNN